jgi:septal ring factor EnvC (AmiA/AmiB activator)
MLTRSQSNKSRTSLLADAANKTMSIVGLQHPDNSSSSTNTTHHHEDEEEIVQLQQQLDVTNKNAKKLKERFMMRNRKIQNKSNYIERLETNQKTLDTEKKTCEKVCPEYADWFADMLRSPQPAAVGLDKGSHAVRQDERK